MQAGCSLTGLRDTATLHFTDEGMSPRGILSQIYCIGVGSEERKSGRMCVLRVSWGEEGREREKEGGKVNGIKDVLLSQFYITVFSCIMSGRFSKDQFY